MMANGEVVAYSIASFICALFVLEFGADKFIDHTVIVAKRTGIPQTTIALLTAGAEWEELAVVVISIARKRSSLAVGNIVGSAISNILGAFSLGLLFHNSAEAVVFDKSSKVYAVLLLLLTGLIAGIQGFGQHIDWKAVGGSVIGLFVLYVGSIGWAIQKGRVRAPEFSDSDSDESVEGDEEESRRGVDGGGSTAVGDVAGSLQRASEVNETRAGTHDGIEAPRAAEDHINEPAEASIRAEPNPATATVRPSTASNSSDDSTPTTKHNLTYHVALLILGFLAIVLSAYVLSSAATSITDEFGISDVLVGVVILAVATTIPEKFIAVISGYRGHMGIMVANTVGSNIFLLTLCMGVLWTSTAGDLDQGTVKPAELGVMFGSAVVMSCTIWFGAPWPRLMGAMMFAGYICFIVLEFAVIRQV